jgi:hypothetical protein
VCERGQLLGSDPKDKKRRIHPDKRVPPLRAERLQFGDQASCRRKGRVLGVKIRQWKSTVWGAVRLTDFVNFARYRSYAKVATRKKSTPKTGGNKGFFGSAALDPRIFVKCLLRGCDRDLRTPEVMTYRHVAGVTSNV